MYSQRRSFFGGCLLRQRMRNRSGAAKFVAGSSVIIGSIRTTRHDGEEDLEPLTSMARQNLPRYWSTSADLQEVSIEFPAERRPEMPQIRKKNVQIIRFLQQWRIIRINAIFSLQESGLWRTCLCTWSSNHPFLSPFI